MRKTLIINGHQPYPFAAGQYNAGLVQVAEEELQQLGYETRLTPVAEGYEVEAEVEAHRWADLIILQFPVNWMSVPWSFKKYMDEVYTAGMDGRLCAGDGRSSAAPKANYGLGGSLAGKHYLLSATLNAPAESFANAEECFFAGATVDDLLMPMHWNMKFFAAQPLPTFSAHDVMKDPQFEADQQRYREHLRAIAHTLENTGTAA